LRGGPGRKLGSLNRSSTEARVFAEKLVTDETYRQSLKERLLSGKLHPTIEVLMWHLYAGRPRQAIDLTSVAPSLAELIVGGTWEPDEEERSVATHRGDGGANGSRPDDDGSDREW
jgi:hypothetical protein